MVEVGFAKSGSVESGPTQVSIVEVGFAESDSILALGM